MKRTSSWLAKNGVVPAPVYEGTFAATWVLEHGRVRAGPLKIRMSCWHQKDKGLDFDRSRDVVGGIGKHRYGVELTDGYLHHREKGLAITTRDPLFSGDTAAKKTRKPPAKAVLRDLIAWLDGDHDNDAVLALAREIAA